MFVILYFTFIRESRTDRMLKKFPGPRDYPIVGHGHKLLRQEDNLEVINGWFKQYGKRLRVYFGSSQKVLMIIDPVDFEKVSTSNELTEKSVIYEGLRDWIGDSLLLSKGKKYFTHRKLLTPAFHVKLLETFQPIFYENSKVLVDILKNLNGNECELRALMARCTLDVICETAMGKKLDSQLDTNNEYLKAVLSYGKEEKANLQTIHTFTTQVIKDRKKAFSPENITNAVQTDEADEELSDFSTKKRFAFLDLLLHIQASGEHELTDKDIQDETDGFMFGGNDSVASAITWAIYLLGRHPLQQSKVHEELDSVFGDDKSASIESKDLRKLKYLEMCIKESMRLYPAIPLFSRSVLQDFELDTNSVVPKGAIIMFNLYSANRNAENFPDPEEYRPERFSAENCEKRNPYAFMPFSAGPRKCMGPRFVDAEEKTILANIFRNFQVTSLDSPENVKPVPQVVLKPKDGIRVKFDRR